MDDSEAQGRDAGNRRLAALRARARRFDEDPRVVTFARAARRVLPGDDRFGDPLSTAGDEQAHVAGRGVSRLTADRPGLLREAGLGALQVWQSISENAGRGRGERDLAIAFTDLVDFSEWALQAGDDLTLELLRSVGEAIEPPVRDHGGKVVKRLGDGMMAVFDHPSDALAALLDGRRALESVEVGGYAPQLRAGIHFGRPRRIGGDYLGVDVNVAARIADEAGGGEILVSDRALGCLDEAAITSRRKRKFRIKGVPKDISMYSVRPREG